MEAAQIFETRALPSNYVAVSLAETQESEDNLGYSLVPPHLDQEILSPEQVLKLPWHLAKGLGSAAIEMTRHYSGRTENVWPEPIRRSISIKSYGRTKEHERTILETEPHPEEAAGNDTVVTDVLFPGLTEMDIGSAKLLHVAVAEQNPSHKVITVTTPGVSMTGQVLSIWEGLRKPLDQTADDNLHLLRQISEDGPSNFVGTSLGSYIVMLMAAKNISINSEWQINAAGIKLVSPAIGARNVPEAERFRDGDIGEQDLIDDVTNRFFQHMPGDIFRMFLRHPEKVGECAAVLSEYALSSQKLLHRLAAVVGNLKGVQAGIEWGDIKQVAQTYPVHILGGEVDPLMQEQLAQWLAVKKIAPRTKIRVVAELGHAMTVDGPGAALHLFQMEQETVRTLAATA